MNPALAQRIIAQQGATNAQNAAGQSGVLRAQQQLSAQQQLGNVYAQQAGEGAQNLSTLTQAQTAANNSNAAAAGQNASIGANLTGGILGGASSFLGLAHGGEAEAPEVHIGRLLIAMKGKKPKNFAGDGDPSDQLVTQSFIGDDPANSVVQDANLASAANPIQANAPSNKFSTGFNQATKNGIGVAMAPVQSPAFANVSPPQLSQPQQFSVPMTALSRAHGGKVPAMISPGERVIPPQYVKAVREGKKKASEVAPKIPGKARVSGDSEKNDVVPANLAEGSVVIKRTKADNDSDAREFLKAIQADKKKKEGPGGFNKVLEARRKRSA
jgi:hypothetical protein